MQKFTKLFNIFAPLTRLFYGKAARLTLNIHSTKP